MSMGGLKNMGFSQGIYEISSTAKEILGTLMILEDGRAFRYAKAGATALGAGKMGQSPAISSYHTNCAVAVAAALGEFSVQVTVSAGTAIAENELAGGYLQVNDATGEGYQYPIGGNTALSASGTAITVQLKEQIRKALTTSSEVTLVHSPWYGIVEASTTTGNPAGVAPVDVTASYYYWAQVRGIANVLCYGTPAVGAQVAMGTTSGSVAAIANSATTMVLRNWVGTVFGTVGISTEYKPIKLNID